MNVGGSKPCLIFTIGVRESRLAGSVSMYRAAGEKEKENTGFIKRTQSAFAVSKQAHVSFFLTFLPPTGL